METLGLTEEQAEAVAHRGGDLLVTAGAGSGKTRVLVERYLSLLDEHGIREMAAVTFTDAAATEMRERVRREVLARPGLAHHRADLDEAVIGTIHSLGLQVLRENPVKASIDPATQVLSDDEAEFELINACVDALEAAADADDARALALREIGVFQLTSYLPLMVARRDEVEAAYRSLGGSSPADWAEHVQSLLEDTPRAAVEEARPHLAGWISWLREAHTGPGEDALSRRLHDVLAALGDPNEGDWSDLRRRLLEAAGIINLTGGSARNWAHSVSEVRDRMRSIRDTGRRLEALPCWNEHDEIALEALASLRMLFDDACARYASRKRELSALDYLDLEVEAVRLLREHPEIAASYRERFRHIMVDEFQDTNPSQVALIDLLSGGDHASPSAPERFFVGDVKQAIYRFRGSDVRHFTRLQREIASAGATRALSRSFRAHDPLVEVLNVIFDGVFGEATEEFEAPMQTMRGRGPHPPGVPYCVLQPVSNEMPDGGSSAQGDRRRVEADTVAAEAAMLLQTEAAVWDAEAEVTRATKPSDIAILLRRLTNVHVFEQALESHGVPYRTAAGVGFFTRQEVLDLTNLLGWLSEPDDSIALVGALRSPLFMIDDQTLLALRSQGYDMIYALGHPPSSVPGRMRGLCLRAAQVLTDLRGDVPFAAPDALLERALALTGFEASWAPLQGGDQAVANIRKFVGLARTLADHSLDELVSYVRRRRDELAAREGQAVLDDSDAVRLLTVHGAKGLEFPIVFVPEAHLPSRLTVDPVRWRAEEGIAPTLTRDEESEERARRRPGFYSYLLERDKAEEAAEHKRLFYVAATRAADRLYVSGDESRGGEGWITSATKALEKADFAGLEIRPALSVDLEAIARRPAPAVVRVPREDEEEELMPPLVARPPVIPLRSSTPVTALRAQEATHVYSRHGDGLGLVRGNVAHRAVEVWFTTGERPALDSLVRQAESGLSEDAVATVIAEVDAMLDIFDSSALAATVREPNTNAHFELPFSWDWQGVPVHGTIDLAYERHGTWHLVDFKTDDTRGRSLRASSRPYLPQLALYASALERATARRPAASLFFLRTGDAYTPTREELDEALEETRERVATGQILETPASPAFDDAPTRLDLQGY